MSTKVLRCMVFEVPKRVLDRSGVIVGNEASKACLHNPPQHPTRTVQ